MGSLGYYPAYNPGGYTQDRPAYNSSLIGFSAAAHSKVGLAMNMNVLS